jgi:membrane-associated phospholipid phosphatase
MLVSGRAGAADPARDPAPLRHDLRVDLPITAALASSVIALTLLRRELGATSCGWCDGDRPSDLNAVDDWFRTALRRPDGRPARVLSDVLGSGVAPLSAAALTIAASVADRRSSNVLVDLVVIAQATLATLTVTELVKPVFGRPRPYLHATTDPAERAEILAEDSDALRSFPSGHTATTFALAAASGAVATMRGYRIAPVIWAAGMTLATATAYARVAGDRHYFTDTIGGSALGVLLGAGIPLLFHAPTRRPVLTTHGVPGGRVVGVAWTF